MSTKKLLLFGVVLCCAITMEIFFVKRNQKFDFNSITDNRLKDVDVIEPSQDTDGVELFNFLKDQKFILYRGKLGNTARRHYVMYNSNRDRLFSVTDVGNQNIIVIEIEGKEETYQRIAK